jgi:hypothetical protein
LRRLQLEDALFQLFPSGLELLSGGRGEPATQQQGIQVNRQVLQTLTLGQAVRGEQLIQEAKHVISFLDELIHFVRASDRKSFRAELPAHGLVAPIGTAPD